MAQQDRSQRELMLASYLHRPLPPELTHLMDLALDLRWHGSEAGDRLWKRLDPDAWEQTENPFLILQNVSQARLNDAAHAGEFMDLYHHALQDRERALDGDLWFPKRHADTDLKSVAYFSMEFGLSESLPIYSGGLGLLAGDHLKTASDMGVPLTAIGLLYQQGYFRQGLTADGWQMEAFPYNDPTSLPVTPVQKQDGGWLRVPVELPGRTMLLRIWQVCVGNVDLYLLDSNDPLNSPWDRAITASLYPTEPERRLIQEIVLGIGGWNTLAALGIDPEVCHLNEGHAAFATLARTQSFMEKTGQPFAVALSATRAGNVFTTHTAVPAGFDRFDPGLIYKYLGSYADKAGIAVETLLGMGRQAPHDSDEMFNIALFALRSSGRVNAVSRLHAKVSRHIFEGVYPRWPEVEVPVAYVTNGVHVPTWDSEAAGDLWTRVCGADNWQKALEGAPPPFDKVGDADLWNFRTEGSRALIEYVRRRLVRQVHAQAAPPEVIEHAPHVLDPNTLTLGFARRFATYKRPTLLLHDAERFARLLSDTQRPVQLIVAGKAHPADLGGKQMVQAMAHFAARPDLAGRVVFLEDYDIALMQELAAGVDIWINTPRRPWEACGTSGMKLLVNGGLNLSELDGWWAEAYAPELGWALGDGQEHGEDPAWDAHEAEQLYQLLEQQIVPEFYYCGSEGMPHHWINRIRASLTQLTPQFSSYRMVQEYVEHFYLPAASGFRRRAANNAGLALTLQNWHKQLTDHWHGLRFGDVQVTRTDDQWQFDVNVYLDDLDAQNVHVELYAEPEADAAPAPVAMERIADIVGAVNGHLYRALVPAKRPAEDYTPRIVPFHPDAAIPIEEEHILWQR